MLSCFQTTVYRPTAKERLRNLLLFTAENSIYRIQCIQASTDVHKELMKDNIHIRHNPRLPDNTLQIRMDTDS